MICRCTNIAIRRLSASSESDPTHAKKKKKAMLALLGQENLKF